MQIIAVRAFLISFAAGLALLFGAYGVVSRLGHPAPELPRGPLPLADA
jgi:hypothetical protein